MTQDDGKNQSSQYYDDEYWDEDLRYKENFIKVKPHNYNFYTKPLVKIQFEQGFKEIKNPFEYEMEYKRRNMWSLSDI